MHKKGNFVKIKFGPFKDLIGKIIDIDNSKQITEYYIQLSDERIIRSIAFYFKGTNDGYDANDFSDIEWNRATAIPVIPPRVEEILNQESDTEESAVNSSPEDEHSEMSNNNENDENENEVEEEEEKEADENGVGADVANEENNHPGKVCIEHPMYGTMKWEPRTGVSGEIAENIYRQDTKFHWQSVFGNVEDTSKSIWNYFQLMFPMDHLETIVSETNKGLIDLKVQYPNISSCEDISVGELLKYFGIRLLISLLRSHESIKMYWSVESEDDTVLKGGCFNEKYGMSRQRFENIESALAFGPHDQVYK